jgi:AraC-like DNA-binding protein
MFRCRICGIQTDHNKGFVFHSKNHSCYYFLYFLTPFFCEIDGKRIVGNAGDCIIHKKGDRVIHGPISENESFINNWMLFDCDDENIEAFDLPYNQIFRLGDEATVEYLLSQIMKEEAIDDEHSQQIISGFIYQLLVEFKRQISIDKGVEKTVFEKFSAARTVILNDYGKNWTLEEMAELVDYSVSRFCALYKSYFLETPINDLLAKRLTVSKQLLAVKAYKIRDIATMCGFSSQHYFSKFFKAHTGKSPREYLQL